MSEATKREADKADMPATDFMERLTQLNACSDGKAFVMGKTLRQAWEAFDRPDWMLWLLGRSTASKKVIATIAVEFAEQSVHHAKAYPAVAECIKVTKQFLAGNATREELWSARAAAARSAREAAAAAEEEVWEAAWAAVGSAWVARAAAARSARAAAAEEEMWEAAWAAVGSAWVARAAAWVAWAACEEAEAARQEQCNIIRRHVSADEIVKVFT